MAMGPISSSSCNLGIMDSLSDDSIEEEDILESWSAFCESTEVLLKDKGDLSVGSDFVSYVHVLCKHSLDSLIQDHFLRVLEETFEKNGATKFWMHFEAYSASAMFEPMLGPDGKKKEPESNVLLALIENMQYAVTSMCFTRYSQHLVLFRKLPCLRKNGGMQALVQYPDVTTASVAKEALEGHCIYDGGYCKLHLSYSRHTDLNVKAHNDRSRDYTIPESGLHPMQQASALPAAAGGWQNPQATSMYTGNPQAQPVDGQTTSWDPRMQQASRSTFISVPSTFPSQTFTPSAGPTYSSGGMQQQNVRPGGAPPSGQPS